MHLPRISGCEKGEGVKGSGPDAIARVSSSRVHCAARIPPSTFPIISSVSWPELVSTFITTMSPSERMQQSVALLFRYRRSTIVSGEPGVGAVVGHDASSWEVPFYESALRWGRE